MEIIAEPFSYESVVPCHGTTTIKVLYTNMAKSVDSWIKKVEAVLDSSATTKIVGFDVEYTPKGFHQQTAAVVQFCVGTDVLVYHYCHGDKEPTRLDAFTGNWHYTFAGFDITTDRKVLSRSTPPLYVSNHKDIQTIWRDPDKPRKRIQGMKDVAAAIIDPYYQDMKDGFGENEHRMWADAPPLPDAHVAYAARDAYVSYELYRRLDVFERGFFCLFKSSEKKRAREW